MVTKNLLVELFVEELPPKALKKLGESFAAVLADSLKAQGLASTESAVTSFASPRRLAVRVGNVIAKAADKPTQQKLMPANVALDGEGKPTQSLSKKIISIGLDVGMHSIGWAAVETEVGGVSRLVDMGVRVFGDAEHATVHTEKMDALLFKKFEGKADVLYIEKVVAGVRLHEGLQVALSEALAKLPIPKVMTYQLADGWSSVQFVRPAHRLVALYGSDVVPVSVLGLQSGRTTQGHRFEAASATLEIRDADSYEAQLEKEGAVIPGFEKRRAEIVRQLAAAAAKVGGGVKPIEDDALLDEVAGLVERPNVLLCQFEAQFLEVPQECLILTMKANQKYFPLLDANGKLTNKFLVVSNIRPDDASAVIGGNERVVRPRLADAKFFYDQDRKQTLESRIEKLGSVVYHNKLGTQLQRVERVTTMAGTIARLLGADKADAELAARLSKADLVTDMVGEFPELQGVMGRYYALHDGEKPEVADAIEAHYHPRFAGDTLPQGALACAVALADKLETVMGIYGVGQAPTGDKDPFGLRRHALGILRILAETPLNLKLSALLKAAADNFPAGMLGETVVKDVEGFMLDRLRGYLRERNFEATHIEAVLVMLNGRVHQVLPRLEGVRSFAKLAVAADLAAANKRVQNIMRKNEELGVDFTGMAVQPGMFKEDAERNLYQAIQDITPMAKGYLEREEYDKSLKALVTLKPFIDDFFDKVMVMCEDKELRKNRAVLLQHLGRLMNQVADISRLAA